jgi:hypothetical protein
LQGRSAASSLIPAPSDRLDEVRVDRDGRGFGDNPHGDGGRESMGDRGLRRCRPPPGVRVSYMRKQLSRVLFGGKPVNVGGTRDFASTLRCGVFVDDLVIGESGSKEFAHRVGLTAAHDRSIRGSGRRTADAGGPRLRASAMSSRLDRRRRRPRMRPSRQPRSWSTSRRPKRPLATRSKPVAKRSRTSRASGRRPPMMARDGTKADRDPRTVAPQDT